MDKSTYNNNGKPLTYKACRTVAQYRHLYQNQTNFQSAYFELTEGESIIRADWNGEIGNAVPFSVYHGRDRRYSFNPSLKMPTVNRIGRAILPLLERVRAGLSVDWDGNNYTATLTPDALAAEREIEAIIEDAETELYNF
jgi:hypothetical protein